MATAKSKKSADGCPRPVCGERLDSAVDDQKECNGSSRATRADERHDEKGDQHQSVEDVTDETLILIGGEPAGIDGNAVDTVV